MSVPCKIEKIAEAYHCLFEKSDGSLFSPNATGAQRSAGRKMGVEGYQREMRTALELLERNLNGEKIKPTFLGRFRRKKLRVPGP